MKQVQDRIEEIKNSGYPLDFGNVFNHTFENYKKIALYAGSMILIFFVIVAFILGGITVTIFGLATLKQFANPENMAAESLVGMNLVIYLVTLVALSCLFSPFFAGFLKMAQAADIDEEFHISSMFQYYKAPYFKEIVIATAVISLVSTLISSVFNLMNIEIIGSLLSLAITFLTILVIPLIIFGKLNAIEAIKGSLIIISKQPLTLLALVITGFIASLVGFIGCCIGVIFTLPFMYSLYYAIYYEIIGFETEKEYFQS